MFWTCFEHWYHSVHEVWKQPYQPLTILGWTFYSGVRNPLLSTEHILKERKAYIIQGINFYSCSKLNLYYSFLKQIFKLTHSNLTYLWAEYDIEYIQTMCIVLQMEDTIFNSKFWLSYSKGLLNLSSPTTKSHAQALPSTWSGNHFMVFLCLLGNFVCQFDTG